MTRDPLPPAESRRWQPLRSGLMNIFRYDYDEFHFERGRLLLRGNNGTGKSRVLALQLPFLLDGDVSPTRLEPDGDIAKRIEWNLLLDKHDNRTGYTWIEFGRVDDDGREHYTTLGCGLHAVQGRTGVTRWFFVTTQRIGKDLFLQTANRQALGQEALKQALGTSGQLFTTADAYRKAVDHALFQLGSERYGALVDLLIKLRQPQLSRQLDEARLSRALSDALPPLPASVLNEVAEAFRSLEDDQAKLRTYQSARDGAQLFLRDYERYCKIAARRRSEAVRQTHADYESAQRQLRTHEAELEQATAVVRTADAELVRLGSETEDTETAIEVLKESDAMRDADALARAERDAASRASESAAAAARLAETEAAHLASEAGLTRATQAVQHAREALKQRLKLAQAAATVVGLAATHDAELASTGLPEPSEAPALARAKQAIAGHIKARKDAATHLRGLVKAVTDADNVLSQRNAVRSQAETAVGEGVERVSTASERTLRETEAIQVALRTWTATLRELPRDALAGIEEALARWCESGDGDNPLGPVVNAAAELARQQLSTDTAEARLRERDALNALKTLEDEQRLLASGRHAPPPSPHTRDPKLRAFRPGAPLWQLCDFRSDLDASTRAGLEAALESSGLLDAWVTPAGELLPEGEHDTVLAADAGMPASTPLAHFLAVEIDTNDTKSATITPEVVAAILTRIGARDGDGEVWVDPRGTWQLGPLRGAWHKPVAQHIGAGAREIHRRQRLAELAEQIAQANAALAEIRERIAALNTRAKLLRAELEAVPKDSSIRSAHAALTASRAQLHQLRERLIAAEHHVRDARNALTLARRIRDDDARDLDMSAWLDNLPGHDDALAEYRQSLAELWPAASAHDSTRQQHSEAATRATAALHRRDADRDAATLAATAARKATLEFRTLEQTRGAAAREIVAQLAMLRERHIKLRADANREGKRRDEYNIKIAVATTNIQQTTSDMQRHDERRGVTIGGLQRFAGLGLLAIACPDLRESPGPDDGDLSAKRAVELARRVEQSLTEVAHDDPSWTRAQRSFLEKYEQLQQTLRTLDFSPTMTPEDEGLYIVTVPFSGHTQTMPEFRDTLNDEIRERQALLAADERRIIEEHLIGEIAAHLGDLLHRGEQWVRRVTEVLAGRATSTGMTLRFLWVAAEDGPPELAAARARLLRSSAVWSQKEREEVGRFLHAQIDRARAADEPATWHEHLTRAFDYREWHRIVVERKQDGDWKRLTKRTHGTGSGGEKAIALTLPQFAAAAAHYDSSPLAPRLILLDEAFVGVDGDMRSKCMGFLDHFDLDFVMTSEREWGCYATLPGLAIYQLVNRPGISAIGMTRWLWNGTQRVRTDTPAADPRPPQAASHGPQLTLVSQRDLEDEGDDEHDGA